MAATLKNPRQKREVMAGGLGIHRPEPLIAVLGKYGRGYRGEF